MALPQVSVSKISFTTPSGVDVRMRPYTGKEEKALLTARQANDQKEAALTVIDVLSSCTDIDVGELPICDFEPLFVKAFEISVDQSIKFRVKCTNTECGHTVDASIGLERVGFPVVEEKNEILDVGKEEGSKKDVKLALKIPTIRNVITAETDEAVIYSSVDCLLVGDNEIDYGTEKEFIEWMMSQKSLYSNCLKYIKNLPKISLKHDWKCPSCEHENHLNLDSFQDFFR